LCLCPLMRVTLERKKERLRQQSNPCLRELRKTFTFGASTTQTSTIKLGRRSLVGVGRVLKRAICSFLCDTGWWSQAALHPSLTQRRHDATLHRSPTWRTPAACRAKLLHASCALLSPALHLRAAPPLEEAPLLCP